MSSSIVEHYISRHEMVLQELVAHANIPAQKIKDAMIYSLFPGGKRIRPILVYLCGELIHVNPSVLDIIGVAIELTHCYSLVHDDLPAMDNDDFRRGKPSCHRAFDEATAILVGDGMQAFSTELLLTHLPEFISSDKIVEITLELVKACGISGMVSGQSLDLSELVDPNISEIKLRHIHRLKTGCLIKASVEMVLSAGNPDNSSKTGLREFANHLGLVFQMQDDYLDRYCETHLRGKGRSSDAENQKNTYANLFNQQELSSLIYEHFNQAEQALETFGQRANDLRFLLNNLQTRR